MSATVRGLAGGIPSLAPRLVLPDGQEVNTGTDPWELRDISYGITRLQFGDFTALHADTLLQLQHTMGYFLETRSISHAINLFMRFRAFHEAVLVGAKPQSIRQVELAHLLSWQGQLCKRTIWYLGVVRILLEKAASLGYGFCSTEVLAWLDEAVITGNPKGGDV